MFRRPGLAPRSVCESYSGCNLGGRTRLKAGHGFSGQFTLQHGLNVCQRPQFVRAHQRNCITAAAGSSGSADAMDV
ncbi:MAG: hypothetical protein Q7U25_05715, partial [Sulfuricella sp.]|nr:hypothetical protein [Sulfuricella sp.]